MVMFAVATMAVLGIYNYQKLPIDAVPDITNVQVQINTAAPGYSPLETEQRITFPIESVMAGLPSLEQTRSLSRYGLSQVTVVFKDGTDIHFARQLISQRIQDARDKLPAGMTPTMSPIATGLSEIYLWTVDAAPGAKKADGTPYTPTDLREIQDWIIKPQLRNVAGVTEINSIGGYDKEYLVAPSPAKLASFGLTLANVVTALERNNANVGAGYIEKEGEQYLLRAPGQVTSIEDIGNIVVDTVAGTSIRSKDLAEVGIGADLRTGAATRNGPCKVPKSGTINRQVRAAWAKKASRIAASDATSRNTPCPDTAADLTPAPLNSSRHRPALSPSVASTVRAFSEMVRALRPATVTNASGVAPSPILSRMSLPRCAAIIVPFRSPLPSRAKNQMSSVTARRRMTA